MQVLTLRVKSFPVLIGNAVKFAEVDKATRRTWSPVIRIAEVMPFLTLLPDYAQVLKRETDAKLHLGLGWGGGGAADVEREVALPLDSAQHAWGRLRFILITRLGHVCERFVVPTIAGQSCRTRCKGKFHYAHWPPICTNSSGRLPARARIWHASEWVPGLAFPKRFSLNLRGEKGLPCPCVLVKPRETR